jgi:hypothetical protein
VRRACLILMLSEEQVMVGHPGSAGLQFGLHRAVAGPL